MAHFAKLGVGNVVEKVVVVHNYSAIGFKYNETLDAFIPPKRFKSWILNETSCLWEAPVAYPEDGQDYDWNETDKTWDLVE